MDTDFTKNASHLGWLKNKNVRIVARKSGLSKLIMEVMDKNNQVEHPGDEGQLGVLYATGTLIDRFVKYDK